MDGVADTEISSANRRTLRKWTLAFDQAFRDDTSEFSSWISSYTGQPIPAAEMEDWLEGSIRRMLSNRPRSVLEIGCGTGAIAKRLTPHIDRYVGIDLSPSAIEQLKASYGEESTTHSFACCAAHEVASVVDETFDAVVFNSVIQYFPDLEYLNRVLAASISLLNPGGSIFIGDVRHADLKPVLAASVALATVTDDASVAELLAKIEQLSGLGNELLVSPETFHALDTTFPRISKVRTLLKFGRFENELTRFRYDVLLTFDAPDGDAVDRISWGAFDDSLDELEHHLQRVPDRTVAITNVRNARLVGSLIAERQIATSTGDWTAAGLRELVAHPVNPGSQPYAFEALGQRLGRVVSVSWNPGSIDSFDVEFAPSVEG